MTNDERNKAAAQEIQRARQAAGYTQQELADLIGTTVGTLQWNESGRRAPIPSIIYGAGEHAGLDVDKVFAILVRMPPDLAEKIAGEERLIKKVREIVER